MEIPFQSAAIRAEFDRWLRHFGESDGYDQNDTVGLLDVLRAHFLIADFFHDGNGSGLGGVGPRDPNLLHSAVYRQFVAYGGKHKWATPYEKAATLVFGVVSDHPFHDANKRTGLLVLLYALHKMNRSPTVRQTDLENLMVEIAAGDLAKYRRHKELARIDDDADVHFIADYLKRNSRARDSRFYGITFHELDQRLRTFGYRLENLSKNYIDVVRVETRRTFLGLGRESERVFKVAQIGCPGLKSRVNAKAIGTVRRATGLVAEKGVDSATFFHGADPLNSLIDEYSTPLQRLAFR